MTIHNRYLPAWAHRLANAALAAASLIGIAVLGFNLLSPMSKLKEVCWWLVWAAAPVGLAVSFLNPRRFSLVNGIGGDVGYDELRPPKQTGG